MSIAADTHSILKEYGFSASKRFGQNFLKDRSVLEDIVRASGTSKEDIVVEIGPGLGTLTEYLAAAAGQVYAIEVDKKLIPILNETLSDLDNVEVINEDILKTDLGKITGGRPFRVVANLPYYITTPVIMSLLEADLPCRSITVMVQKEVGERMTARPRSKEYGALTLAVEYHADTRIVRKVPAGCFVPMPNVDSVVVHMDIYEEKPVKVGNEELLFGIIRGAFNQRRKTLVNALAGYAALDISKDRILEALEKTGEKPTVRGEELSLQKYTELTDALSD